MDTHADPVSPDVSEFYLAKINSLVADGRESLIAGLAAEYDRLRREAPRQGEEAA